MKDECLDSVTLVYLFTRFLPKVTSILKENVEVGYWKLEITNFGFSWLREALRRLIDFDTEKIQNASFSHFFTS